MSIRKDSRLDESRTTPLPKPVFLWYAMQNDIDIFRGIKSEIQKNPENFKPAGQWLDDFCQNIVSQEEQYIKKLPQTESNTLRESDKKKNLLKKIHKEKKTLTGKIVPYTHNDKKYKKEKKQLAELFCEANQLTLEINKLAKELEHIKVKSQEKPSFVQLMSKAFEEASCEYPCDNRKIILIVWLLTDTYLHESELEITKYEKYHFSHEIIELEDNGRKRLVSEQELAKDAVFARPGAMEIIRDAYLSYKGLFPRESKQILVLKKFIEIHCDLSARSDVRSKVALLHEYNLKEKIELPKLAHKYRKGQHKYYYVDDLKKNWPAYQEKMPTLPPLKVAGN